MVLYARLRKMPLLGVLDLCAAPVALGHAIGRLGCFVAGCCYGKPTSLPWGVTFTSPIAARISGTPLDVSLHPTQLYEAAAEFLNFLLLVWLGTKPALLRPTRSARISCSTDVERGAIEFLRGDPGRTLMFHDTVSLMQIVSVGLVLTGRSSGGAASAAQRRSCVDCLLRSAQRRRRRPLHKLQYAHCSLAGLASCAG